MPTEAALTHTTAEPNRWVNVAARPWVAGISAFLIGGAFLGSPSLWLDEAYTAEFVTQSWSTLFSRFPQVDAMFALFYSLTKVATDMFGTSEAALRLVSLVAFAAAAAAIVALANLVSSRRVAAIAAVLAVVNPFLVQHGREARTYALVAMLATLATIAFVRATHAPAPARVEMVAYVLLGTLAVYAQVFAVLIIAVHLATVLVSGSLRGQVGRFVVPWLSIAVLSSPVIGFVLLGRGAEGSWIPRYGVTAIPHIYRQHTGGWLPVILFFGLCGVAAASLVYERIRLDAERWIVVMLVIWVTLPTAAVFTASFVVPSFIARYLIVMVPGLIILAALGASAIRSGWLRVVVVGCLVVGSVAVFAPKYRDSFEDWRSATAWIVDGAQAGDSVIFFAPDTVVPYAYYANDSSSIGPTVIEYVEADNGVREPDLDAFLAAIDGFDGSRLWVVLSHDFEDERLGILPALEMDWDVQTERSFPDDIAVMLVRRR